MYWRLAMVLLVLILGTQCRSSSSQVNSIPPGPSATVQPASESVDLKERRSNDNSAPLPSSIPVDVTEFPNEKLHEYEEQLVTVRGKFSLYGVVGPFITIPAGEIYFVPEGNFSWGKEYDRVERRQITVTGVLHFRRFKPSNEQHPSDYFYFRAETTPIKLK